jgi:hypothetical protein
MKKLFILFAFLVSFGEIFSQAPKTDAALTTQAQQIKNETIPSQNTPLRIGTEMLDEIASKVNNNQYAGVGTGGTTTAYTATVFPAIISYPSYYSIKVTFHANNTGSATLALNGLTAKVIKRASSGAIISLVADDIVANVPYWLIYNGTNFILNTGGTSGGGGGGVWGTITGTLGDQTDLQSVLDSKLTNQTADNNFQIYKSSDPTAAFEFSASAIPTGTLNHYTMPSVDGTLALTSNVPSGILPLGVAHTLVGVDNAGSSVEYKTVSNGLTSATGTLKLGGALTDNTQMTQPDNTNFTIGGFAANPYSGYFNISRSSTFTTGSIEMASYGNSTANTIGVVYSEGKNGSASVGMYTYLSGVTKQLKITTTDVTFDIGSDARGDIYTRNSSGKFSRLPIGAANTYLSGGTDPSYAQVSLSAGVTGDLPFANLTQGSARSVLGVTGNSTADFASIQGTADQVLRVNPAGTALGFGTIAPAAITPGTDTYVLTTTAGVSGWAAPASGFTNPMTTAGDLILGGASGVATRLGIGSNTFVLTSNGTTASWAAPSGGGATVTEKKSYYNAEFYANHALNNTTGAVTSDPQYDITGYIEITPSESITVYTKDLSTVNIYGWTYTSAFAAISEIRAVASFGTLINTYTFTTPSNAKYIQLYTRNTGGGPWSIVNRGWARLYRIESAATITYTSPITPEQYSGTDALRIQQALDLQRWTSSKVVANGYYLNDSTLFYHSNTRLEINGRIKMADGFHSNVLRPNATRNPAAIRPEGTRNIRIWGTGTIEGSDDHWGGLPAAGVGTQWWRSIAVLIANVEDYDISGLEGKSTPAWFINNEQSRYGAIRNIRLNQDRSESNQDGINIRDGVHHVTVSGLTGKSGDDSWAITNLVFGTDKILGTTVYDPAETTLDAHDINISDVNVEPIVTQNTNPDPTLTSGGLILYEDGRKVYNVNIDNVSGSRQIRVGVVNSPYWSTSHATVDDGFNFQFTNITAPIYVRLPIKNSSFSNVSRLDQLGITGSAAVPEGSLNISRKYKDRQQEYFPSVTVFDPTTIPDLEIFYDVSDASTITKSSNLVSQMTDKSGNGHTVSEATNKGTWVDKQIGERAIIRFSTSTHLLGPKIAALQGISGFTAYLIGGAGTPIVWHGFDFSNRTQISGGASPLITICNAGSQFGTLPSTIPYHAAAMYVSTIYDGSQSGNANRLRGFLTSEQRVVSFTGTIPATTESNAGSTFAIGVINNASPVGFTGDFAGFLFYTRVLTAYEDAQVRAWISSHWML